MIAVAATVVMRIAFVAIRRHLVGVTGSMSFGNFLAARHVRAHAYIRALQCMRHRRRLKRENEGKTREDVQDASHVSSHNRKSAGRIVLQSSPTERPDHGNPAKATAPRGMPE
jgi:hypothetical protein